jgi:5-methylcytosine-specific restriction endonuclease McrA
MRKPCSCGNADGVIRPTGGQDCVYCAACSRFQYNAPRTETGREKRSVSTVHSALKPKRRAQVLLRANGACELCHTSGAELHVGHLLSVDDALKSGLTDEEINSLDNLCAMCAECNLGLGKETVPLRLAVSMVMARVRNQGGVK